MAEAANGPVFIIGTERSGSNLLRLMLNAHPEIYIPHPPHIMKDLGPVERLYGDLGDDRNFLRLINDAARLVELHFFPWEIKPDRELAFKKSAARNLYCVKAAFYEQYRRFRGAKRWGCKSTFMVHYAGAARRYSSGAKFIHLVRDGRDVAVSSRDSVFNHFHPYFVAGLWSLQQRQAAALARTMGKDEFITLRYEDLVCEPESSARKACRFLGEDYSPAMLRYFEGTEPKKLASANASWANCAKPVLAGNSGKYRTKLSAGEIELFETVSSAELELFGYRLENPRGGLPHPARPPLPPYRKAAYFMLEKCRMAYILGRSLFTDRNALPMFRKRLFIAVRRLGLLFRL
ncbi:MAG: sulfotransferase [Elusimicrobiales bacterium]|jgi:hypothetical protein